MRAGELGVRDEQTIFDKNGMTGDFWRVVLVHPHPPPRKTIFGDSLSL